MAPFERESPLKAELSSEEPCCAWDPGRALRWTAIASTAGGARLRRSTEEACVRIATYNVHRCIGNDGVCDADRVAAVIAEMGADFISLQEVSCRTPPRGIDQLARIADQAGGYHFERGTARVCEEGETFNALLSKYPASSVRSLDLSCKGCESRAAISASFEVAERRILMIATHFGLRWRERREQARSIAAEIENHPDADLTVVAGDLNDWVPRSPNLRVLRDKVAPARRNRGTFPSWLPLFSLDEIWVSATGAAIDRRVWRTPLARVASDHLPLLARISLRGDG